MAGGPASDISVGTKKIRDAAAQAGIPASALDNMDPGAAVTSLGYAPVAAVDMANAYATLAASGQRADWHVVTKVVGSTGDDLPLPDRSPEQTVPEDVAADTLAALGKVTSSGTGTNGRTICPTVGKTGTATAGEGESQHVSSSWFVGATPTLATAVTLSRGVGNEDLEGFLLPTFFGGQYPALTFRNFMNPALEGTDCGSFPAPANIRAGKGAQYVAPPPRCGEGQQLNEDRDGCEARPEPTPDPEPTPTPTPTAPTPTAPTPTVPTPEPTQTEPAPECTPGSILNPCEPAENQGG